MVGIVLPAYVPRYVLFVCLLLLCRSERLRRRRLADNLLRRRRLCFLCGERRRDFMILAYHDTFLFFSEQMQTLTTDEKFISIVRVGIAAKPIVVHIG